MEKGEQSLPKEIWKIVKSKIECFQENVHTEGQLSRYSDWLRGWTVRGSNPGGGEIFRTCPDQPWGPPSLLYNGYRIFPGGKERQGRDADPSPTSSAIGHGRVELYLYSPYGPYGLYRASVPVQGCTLLYLYIQKQTSHCHKHQLFSTMLIKVQIDPTVCRHLFTATSLYMFRVSRTHHQEY